jgi:hypothetical protein
VGKDEPRSPPSALRPLPPRPLPPDYWLCLLTTKLTNIQLTEFTGINHREIKGPSRLDVQFAVIRAIRVLPERREGLSRQLCESACGCRLSWSRPQEMTGSDWFDANFANSREWGRNKNCLATNGSIFNIRDGCIRSIRLTQIPLTTRLRPSGLRRGRPAPAHRPPSSDL